MRFKEQCIHALLRTCADATSYKTMQLIGSMFEKATVQVADVPVVPKSYDDGYLRCERTKTLLTLAARVTVFLPVRRPPYTQIGERECACGELCLCVQIAAHRHGKENDVGFVGTEFLLPTEREDFLAGRGLPKNRKKCLVCTRYFQNYLYWKVRVCNSNPSCSHQFLPVACAGAHRPQLQGGGHADRHAGFWKRGGGAARRAARPGAAERVDARAAGQREPRLDQRRLQARGDAVRRRGVCGLEPGGARGAHGHARVEAGRQASFTPHSLEPPLPTPQETHSVYARHVPPTTGRFKTRHYRYVRSAEGSHLVQVGIGAADATGTGLVFAAPAAMEVAPLSA